MFRNKKDENWVNLDPSFRFRLHVENRARTYPDDFIENDEVLERLFKQKASSEKSRDGIIRSLMILFGILFMLVNGADMTLPILKMQISEIPSLLEVIVCALALGCVIFSMKFSDVSAVDAIIDGVIRAKNGVDNLKNHMIKASYYPESSFWILLQRHHIGKFEELYSPGRRAHFFAILLTTLAAVILLAMMFLPLIFILYVAMFKLPHTVAGVSISIFSVLCVLFTILVIFMNFFRLPHDIITESQIEDDEMEKIQ